MMEPVPIYQEAKMSQMSQIEVWADTYPAVYRVYWQVRGALQDMDGNRRKHHHNVAVVVIHDAFASNADRSRLGLPRSDVELANLLGVSRKTLTRYRNRYGEIFGTTQETIRSSFISTYYGRVLEALGESASDGAANRSADRRLFLTIAGDLTERLDVTSEGERLETAVQIYLPGNGRDGDGDGD